MTDGSARQASVADVRVLHRTFHRARAARVDFKKGPSPAPRAPARRPAKVARMLALAHHIEAAINRGIVKDRAEVARRLGLTRARITQILDLTLLAPDIQERILCAEAVDGIEPLTERILREVIRVKCWANQRNILPERCSPLEMQSV